MPLISFFTEEQSIYWIYFDLYSKPIVWFAVCLVFMVSVLPDLVLKVAYDLSQKRRLEKYRIAEETRIREFSREMVETNFNYSFKTIHVYYLSSGPINSTAINNYKNGVKTKAYRAKLNYDTGDIDVETKLDRPNERLRNFLSSASRTIPKTSFSSSNLVKRTRSISSRIMSGLFSESAPTSSANLNRTETVSSEVNLNEEKDDRLI